MDMMEREEVSELEAEEDIMESEEEEEAEQLEEEMRPPFVTSWVAPDGVRVDGIVCIDDGLIRLKNQCRSDDCPICLQPSTSIGKHQLCCLPCGHMYGFSCIKKWLLPSSSSSSRGKCPQCNTLCSFQDAILLYPPRLCVTHHQKASSAAFFPFTKQGYLDFTQYEYSRMLDAELLRVDDIRHMDILLAKQIDLADRAKELAALRDHLLTLADESSSLGQAADALRTQASLLKPRLEALGRRADSLERLVTALRRRMDALELRSDAFESRMTFYSQMSREHRKREAAKANQGGFENKNDLSAPPKPIKKAAKMKLKDKEIKDGKKMLAIGGTFDVPVEEMVEDVAVEPTTNTTVCVRVRSRSNIGNCLHSIAKLIHKRNKSNNYMYYYAAAVVTVPLAVGYTLYA